jgi:long-chain acyl-CoA synthetase
MKKIFKNILSVFRRQKTEKEYYSEIEKNFLVNGKLIYAGQLLQLACKKFGSKTALICQDQTINYNELYFRSVLLSNKLKNLGVVSGDRVLLYFENSIDFYIGFFSIVQLGAIVVPLNVYLHEKELSHIVKDSGAQLAIVSNGMMPTWNKLSEKQLIPVQDLPKVLTQDEIDWQSAVPANSENLPFTIVSKKPEELCVLLYTSGTTGVPKGVMLSSNNVLINAMQAYARLHLIGKQDEERFFSVIPLFHSFAQCVCVWLPVMIGSCTIVVKKIDRKLILEGLTKKPTIFVGFPALYGLLCLLKTAPLNSIRIFVSGADMLPDKIRSAFATVYGRKICAGYGLTETSPVVAMNYHNNLQPTDFVGEPLVGIECQIMDDAENVLPAGQVGNLWLRGGNVMMGYYNCPDATAKVLKNGWVNTGDLSTLDSLGRLTVKGRSKDLIIHKGFNIYPQEIENVLLAHPMVLRAAVIGKEDPLSGQIPVAFVALKSPVVGIEKNLLELCSNNLAQYKIPRKFICMEDLPLSPTGKIDKKQLQNL